MSRAGCGAAAKVGRTWDELTLSNDCCSWSLDNFAYGWTPLESWITLCEHPLVRCWADCWLPGARECH